MLLSVEGSRNRTSSAYASAVGGLRSGGRTKCVRSQRHVRMRMPPSSYSMRRIQRAVSRAAKAPPGVRRRAHSRHAEHSHTGSPASSA